ncbi:SUMO1 sentrin specific peptidase 8 [Homalodisca vitripennis]|nr:SUMO1 sentrin specific peptidase 8 [Homalodisca vitripennis]
MTNDTELDINELISGICFEINTLHANYPDAHTELLVSKITDLLNAIESGQKVIDLKNNDLDCSLHDIAELSARLESERNRRKLELDQRLTEQDVVEEEKAELIQTIFDLKSKFNSTVNDNKNLLLLNNTLAHDLNNVKKLNDSLRGNNDIYSKQIKNLNAKLNSLNSQAVLQTNEWDKTKWIDDQIIDSYFDSMSTSVVGKYVFLSGPSSTQLISHSQVTASEIMKLPAFSNSNVVLLCVSNSADLTKEDGGTHWSLLCIDRVNNDCYHFDSLQGSNKCSVLKMLEHLNISSTNLVDMECFQQTNNYECGINVIVNAKHILNYFLLGYERKISLCQWLAQDFDLIRASTENEGSSISNNVQTKSDCKIVLRREGPRDWTIVKRSSYGSRSNHCNTSKCKGSPDLHRVGSEHADGNQLTRETSTVKSLRLFTDSHGRSVSHIWLKTIEHSVRITAHVMPGARMCDVLNAAGPELNVAGQDDCIAILAGTNDISNNGCADITEQIEALCRGASGTNILIVGIPLRFDNTDLNEQISLVNHAIGIICSNYTNVNFISLDSLRRANYTRHGLHLNLGGKRVLCNLLYDSLRYPVFSQPSPLSKKPNLCTNQKFPSSESFYEETTQTGSNSDVWQRIPILITDRSLSRKRSSTVSSIPARRSAVDVASFVYSGTGTDKTIFLEQNRICGKVP